MRNREGRPDLPIFVVFWSFSVNGPVEECDIIGAIYNRTKGLICGDQGLDGLVKNGDVGGMLYVNIDHENGKAEGRLHIQTFMGKKRTARLAAALETVDEIGPGYDAEIRTKKIKFTSGGKKRLAELRTGEIANDKNLWTAELESDDKLEMSEAV